MAERGQQKESAELPQKRLVYSDKVSASFCQKVQGIANRLQMPAEGANWLMTCMHFESSGTFSPSIRNPKTRATGLIQFMPKTAKGLGTSIEALARMDRLTQLDWVEKYFKRYRGKLKALSDVYMTIFYPAAVGKSGNFVIGSEKSAARASQVYRQNRGFDKNKDKKIQKNEATSTLQARYEAGLKALGHKPSAKQSKEKQGAQAKTDSAEASKNTEAKAKGDQHGSGTIYIVQSGDSLSKIAAKFQVPGGYKALASFNQLSNPSLISVGQQLRIPGGSNKPEQLDSQTKKVTKQEKTTNSAAANHAGVVADRKLAQNSVAVAREMRSVGFCARGVSRAVQRTHKFYPGGSGNAIGAGLIKSGKYRQVTGLSLAEALKVPGLIFSWKKTSTAAGKIHGHAAVSQGNGKSSSCDFYENDTIRASKSRSGLKIYSLKK